MEEESTEELEEKPKKQTNKEPKQENLIEEESTDEIEEKPKKQAKKEPKQENKMKGKISDAPTNIETETEPRAEGNVVCFIFVAQFYLDQKDANLSDQPEGKGDVEDPSSEEKDMVLENEHDKLLLADRKAYEALQQKRKEVCLILFV